MNVSITIEELKQVRRLVQILVKADEFGVLSVAAEDEARELAKKIKEWIE